MDILINIGIIIGCLIIANMTIKLATLIFSGIVYLVIKIKLHYEDKKNHKKYDENNNREIAAIIIEQFEDLLSSYDIELPNDERDENEDASIIYGKDYYKLEGKIVELLNER